MRTLPPPPDKTDQNAATNATGAPATNGEFLSAIFTGLAEPHRPFVLGFAGKPKDPKAMGTPAIGWPATEVEALHAARIFGKTNDEIRLLVLKLESARQADF